MPRKAKNAPKTSANGNGESAPTEEPQTKRPRQESLPTLAPPRIKALDVAVDEYQELKTRRMAVLVKELAAKEGLANLLRKHQLTAYRTSDGELTASLEDKTNVKVKRAKDAEDDDDGE